jgi:hypothetical protein
VSDDASAFKAGERSHTENSLILIHVNSRTYEAPYAAVAAIKDHVAFYPDRVDAIEEQKESTKA